jgi:hypothetical protein
MPNVGHSILKVIELDVRSLASYRELEGSSSKEEIVLDAHVGYPIAMDEPDALAARLVRGVVGGELAGMAFAVVTMWFSVSQGKDAKAPLLMMSTLSPGHGSLLNVASGVAAGVLVNLALSALFGAVFALAVPRMRTNGTLLIAGAGYGALLFVIDLRVLAPLFFPAFRDANAAFELLVHLLFGAVLTVTFLSRGVRSGEARFEWR